MREIMFHYMRSSYILVRLQIKRRRQSPSASGNRLGEPCEFGDIVYGTQPNVRALDAPPATVSHIIPSLLYKFDQALFTYMYDGAFQPFYQVPLSHATHVNYFLICDTLYS